MMKVIPMRVPTTKIFETTTPTRFNRNNYYYGSLGNHVYVCLGEKSCVRYSTTACAVYRTIIKKVCPCYYRLTAEVIFQPHGCCSSVALMNRAVIASCINLVGVAGPGWFGRH